MLNLKKGLALVLAAATAFTFAPVANLGAPVQAEAANATKTYEMRSSDITVSGGTATGAVSQVVGVDYNSITYKQNDLTVENGHTYRVVNENNVEVKALDSQTTDLRSTDTTKLWTASGSTASVTYAVKSSAGGSFTLQDMTAGSHTYDNIIVTITNPTGWTNESASAFKPYIANLAVSGSNYVVSGEASHQNAGSNKQYTLTLNNNNSSDYDYAVTYTGSAAYTSWTGFNATVDTDTIKASSVSGGIKWKTADPSTGGIKATIGKNTAAGAFKVTTANNSENIIRLSYTAKFADNTSHDVTADLYYVVDRSDNAVDWVKWNGTKLVTPTKSSDGVTWTYGTEQLDRINKTATILVKSESQDITFISSDSTIVSVKKDPEKSYKATASFVSAGTAVISVYVGGTANNKGKILQIPVNASINAIDKIDVKATPDIYGAEQDDTIFLDAADSTASNKITTVKLDVKSEGGLAWDKFQSNDTSIVSLAADGTLTSTAKNVSKTSPKITTLTFTTKTDLSKHVSAGEKTVTVVVWGKPAADFTVSDVYLNLSKAADRAKTLQTTPVLSGVSWTVVDNGANENELGDGNNVFTLTNSGNQQTTATIVGNSVGTGVIKALVTETATTRPTAKKAKVVVSATDIGNVITPSATSLVINEGEQANLTATSSAAKTVSFTSADPSVATVATAGGIVAAVKPGQTTITLKSEGAADVVVPVIVTAKQTTAVPAAVTGVKVANKKGAKVTVTWTSQDKNINYRVYKKVGNGSWKAKNVAGNKTTLSVKKGAKVTVKVKAYVKDANGKTTWGPKAAQKSLKTDKK